MRITMVGTGYVGLVTGTCLANTGNDVTCLDVVQAKIDKLNAGVSPIYEPGLDELIQRNAKAGRLHFTLDKAAAYGDAEIIFICVGTPSDDKGRADLKYVLAAASDIGEAIEAGPADATPKVVVVKSTVPVGTNAKVQAAIEAKTAKPFHMASNPEFLKEGAAINDFNKQQRKAFWQKVVDFFGGKGTGGLTGKTIGVWGIAFKPGTDDIREAPAISLMERLIDSGATVKAYDPVAHETCQEKLGDRVTYCPEPYAAAEQADALVICTDWDEFKAPDLQRLKTIMNAPVIFDGRNILRNEDLAAAGFTYHSVGRAAVVQEPAAAMA
ncbi:MAG: UDP binding domain-containing protein [Planctomycetota bacterium]